MFANICRNVCKEWFLWILIFSLFTILAIPFVGEISLIRCVPYKIFTTVNFDN